MDISEILDQLGIPFEYGPDDIILVTDPIIGNKQIRTIKSDYDPSQYEVLLR